MKKVDFTIKTTTTVEYPFKEIQPPGRLIEHKIESSQEKVSIQVGSIVTPITNDRFKWMNDEFKVWIENNLENTFFVERVRDVQNQYGDETHRVAKLTKVHFWITEDFLSKI